MQCAKSGATAHPTSAIAGFQPGQMVAETGRKFGIFEDVFAKAFTILTLADSTLELDAAVLGAAISLDAFHSVLLCLAAIHVPYTM